MQMDGVGNRISLAMHKMSWNSIDKQKRQKKRCAISLCKYRRRRRQSKQRKVPSMSSKNTRSFQHQIHSERTRVHCTILLAEITLIFCVSFVCATFFVWVPRAFCHWCYLYGQRTHTCLCCSQSDRSFQPHGQKFPITMKGSSASRQRNRFFRIS